MEITIEQLKTFSPDITQTLNNLLAQLNPNLKKLSNENVKEIIRAQSNRLFVVKEPVDNKIVGMLTLAILTAPSGKRGLLEDIVVDKEYRRKGIGTKLITTALNVARKEGVVYLDFTSRPTRIAANNLYQHLGFKKRDTNVYRIKL